MMVTSLEILLNTFLMEMHVFVFGIPMEAKLYLLFVVENSLCSLLVTLT